jgi:thiosulfate/3-mercaptopyruvate sulfurtransferase
MRSREFSRIFLLVIIGVFACALFVLPARHAQNPSDPWTKALTVEAANLVRELNDPKTAPMVVFVGFQRLYNAGHIKGAEFHGSGGKAEGLNELKSWAATLPKSSDLVIYCGCCPMERCPNVRPAFTALRELGIAKVRVLILPTSFEVDWAEKGYPYEKAKGAAAGTD